MITRPPKLDLHALGSMSHAELVRRLLTFRHRSPALWFGRAWLEKHSVSQLRLILLAAQLYCVCAARRRPRRAAFSQN
jgi:hypothetical protein